MTRHTVLAAALALAALPATHTAGQTAAAAEPAPRTITVTGNASASAAPDIARISLGATTQAREAGDALDGTARAAEALLEVLETAGIERRDIRTTSLNLSPVFERTTPGGAPRPTGYRASTSYSVTVRDFDRVGDVIASAAAAGANDIGQIAFDVAARADLEAEARAAAMEDAATRAGQYAAAAGLAIGPVLSAREGGVSIGRGPMPLAAAAEARAIPVIGGEIGVSASITVTFALEPAE
ncbi:MAG: SIMPL domain-containing protein [Pseudomonadota bacterium]